ncbi:MAG: hypothetical protein J5I98_20010 [Phaeodactylibacter sp.]|nr:hypothetical protein [Phaeodactylibacter sp.]
MFSALSRVRLPQGETIKSASRRIGQLCRQAGGKDRQANAAFIVKRGAEAEYGLTDTLFVRFKEGVSEGRVKKLAEPSLTLTA